jgi:hypothetical protein
MSAAGMIYLIIVRTSINNTMYAHPNTTIKGKENELLH